MKKNDTIYSTMIRTKEDALFVDTSVSSTGKKKLTITQHKYVRGVRVKIYIRIPQDQIGSFALAVKEAAQSFDGPVNTMGDPVGSH